MKEILKNVKMNFKLNSTVFILASVIYLFLLVIGLSLTLIFPFSDVLTVIFIISPFIFTFSYLAYKSSEREILEYKDVYKGYKEVFVSFSYIFKRLVKPLFFSLLIGIGAYFILSTLDLMIIDHEFYKEFSKVSISQDIEAMNNGAIPPQLLVDNVHGNENFYKSYAIGVNEKLKLILGTIG
jgi:hypothetical protein